MEVLKSEKINIETINKDRDLSAMTSINQCGCTDTYCGPCPGMG